MNPFSIPNLPTDNLYKFYALSGIVGILFVNSLFFISVGKILDLMLQTYSAIDVENVELEFILMDLDELDKQNAVLKETVLSTKKLQDSIRFQVQSNELRARIDTSDSMRRQIQKTLDVDENEIYPELEKGIVQNEYEWEKYKKMILDVMEKNRMVALKHVELESMGTKLKIYSFGLIVIGIVAILLNWRLYNLTFYGFQQWKKLVQDPIDRKMQLEIKSLEAEFKKNKIPK